VNNEIDIEETKDFAKSTDAVDREFTEDRPNNNIFIETSEE
jgi:hypothetical protein